jgi:hypothetical protein
MRSLPIIIIFVAAQLAALCQSRIAVEQYSFLGGGQTSLLAPVAHYQTSKKWYAEARYNYEDIRTFSLYAGRVFSGKDDLSWSVIPMIGGMAGKMTGGSVGLNSVFSYGKFNFSSEAQYSVSAASRLDNFFYNWSELWYEPFDWIYTGVALQHTRMFASNSLVDPGVLLGFSYHQWSFPLYSFNPLSNQRYFVVGINWEWRKNSKTGRAATPPLLSTLK